MKESVPTVPATEPAEAFNSHPENFSSDRAARLQLLFEREVVSVHFQPGTSYHGRCPVCSCLTRMVTAEAAAFLAGVSRRQLYRWLDQGRVHFEERSTGEVFLCSLSLERLRLLGQQASALNLPPETEQAS